MIYRTPLLYIKSYIPARFPGKFTNVTSISQPNIVASGRLSTAHTVSGPAPSITVGLASLNDMETGPVKIVLVKIAMTK